MKSVKFFIGILFMFYTLVSNGQKVDSAKYKTVEFMQGITYWSGSQIYAKETLLFETSKEKFILPWFVKKDSKLFSNTLDTVSRNATLKFETDRFPKIELKVEFPMNTTDNDKSFKIKIVQNNLKDSLNKTVKLTDNVGYGYGSRAEYAYKDGNKVLNKWENLNATYTVDPEFKGKKVTGSVIFRAEVATGYAHIKITKLDKGKEFVLNNQKFKVIDILENKVVLSPIDKNEIEDLKFVNLDNNYREIENVSIGKINEALAKDSTIIASHTGQSKVSQLVYNQFKKNPKLEFKEYCKITFKTFMNCLNSTDKDKDYKFFGPKYTIIHTAGPIQNLYLYCPIFGMKKDFEVKL